MDGPRPCTCLALRSDQAVDTVQALTQAGPQVLQSKKKLLDKLHAEVASSEDAQLKRILSEDEGTQKRRELCFTRLKMLRQAQEEISNVTF